MGQAPASLDFARQGQLCRATDLTSPTHGEGERWGLSALRGRLTELVGGADSANITIAARLILHAQREGDFAAWVATHRDVFFPPDVAAAGIDPAALPVVWAVPEEASPRSAGRLNAAERSVTTIGTRPRMARSATRASRAAERLLRSGAFGLVVIDLARDLTLSAASQGRLVRLAEHHDAQVLILRRKREDGIYSGSLVTVRAESSCERIGPGRFRATITNTKDKREGPGWTTSEEFDGPPGLY
ncbi:MAG: recombinase A [Spirochaetota bacterium]